MTEAAKTKGGRETPALALAAILAALGASACCLGPALLAALGLGSLSAASRLTPYRPYLTVLTFLLLGVALYRAYRKGAKGPECCLTEAGRKRQRLTRWVLWAVAIVSLFVLAYPEIADRTRAGRATAPVAPTGIAAAFVIPSMDCSACAAGIEQRLRGRPGVLSARVEYASKRAFIRYDPHRTDTDEIRKLIGATGFSAQLVRPAKGGS